MKEWIRGKRSDMGEKFLINSMGHDQECREDKKRIQAHDT